MLTLSEIGDYFRAGWIRLRLDLYMLPQKKGQGGVHLRLLDEQAEAVLKDGRLTFNPPPKTDPIFAAVRNGGSLIIRPPSLGRHRTRIVLSPEQLCRIIKNENILDSVLKREDAVAKTLTFDLASKGNSLSVSIERGDVRRGQWEKIKEKMREAGFSYRSESPWFHSFEGGKWDRGW